jgi:hypothetical protein
MMHRLFRDRLSNKVENLMLKYTDAGTWLCVCPRAPARTATNRPRADGDLVTMTDSMDVSHALELSNVLRVSVFGTARRPCRGLWHAVEPRTHRAAHQTRRSCRSRRRRRGQRCWTRTCGARQRPPHGRLPCVRRWRTCAAAWMLRWRCWRTPLEARTLRPPRGNTRATWQRTRRRGSRPVRLPWREGPPPCGRSALTTLPGADTPKPAPSASLSTADIGNVPDGLSAGTRAVG